MATKKKAAKAAKKTAPKKESKPRVERKVISVTKGDKTYKAYDMGEVLDKRSDSVYTRYKVADGKEAGKIFHIKKNATGRGGAKKAAKKAAPKKAAAKKSAKKTSKKAKATPGVETTDL